MGTTRGDWTECLRVSTELATSPLSGDHQVHPAALHANHRWRQIFQPGSVHLFGTCSRMGRIKMDQIAKAPTCGVDREVVVRNRWLGDQ
jgi:hypothetical protein